MTTVLKVLGTVLLLGGLGHSVGVTHLYVTAGLPETNRVMLDLWVAEAQFLAGGLYLAAFRSARAGIAWRALAAFGALTAVGFTAAVLPVLFSRAPVIFRIPAIVYLLASIFVLAAVAGSKGQRVTVYVSRFRSVHYWALERRRVDR
jgi:peptidoglycan/LPS O-acetylase OafA/YrhL